ncbi:MAG: phosphoribosylformylglycinamidine synthase subunit PurL [Elusimicrobia bacterium]|nr:phosphoribosylformylglycinamidine synthase subunit PurL [Elusimicrobiota bacterium]
MKNCEEQISNFINLNKRDLAGLNDFFGWSLNALELKEARDYFKKIKRAPFRGDIETIAQTWSEHCKHKTFSGPVKFKYRGRTKRYKNLFKETIVKATNKLDKSWCLSVFSDNAGIVEFGKDKKWGVAFKAETHNHPCAIEPYGGAETGVGGVIRDILGVGLGAKPVLNTDNFCFGRLDSKMPLPKKALSAKRIFSGVVDGVRDYGNRMGIPTASGGIYFDDGYALNPLVYVGCAGIIPRNKIHKKVCSGDLIVSIGGRTGRDGIHGATFSSANIDEDTSSAAVQIGHALNEKKVLDALLKARDLNLYSAVTDCGAGGFSSAIGELGEETGARVYLEKALLKDSKIEPWEIWVSESQERMVLSVPKKNLSRLKKILEEEDCEYCVLGEFTSDKKLSVTYNDETVVNLDMLFLHHKLPNIEKSAVFSDFKVSNKAPKKPKKNYLSILKDILAHPNVCSRHSVISQYDHEVQGGTVIKPLEGKYGDGPGDAAVIWPHASTGNMKDFSGFAVSHGFNPALGKIDPYEMAMHSADEAVRNLLCVGANIKKTAFMDNFCAASPKDPKVMGELVRASEGCYDAAMGFGAPFISGKDSFYNQSKDSKGREYPIPLSLLISSLAPVEDIRKAITMNFKKEGNLIYMLGMASCGMGGSIYNEINKSGNNFISALNIKEAVKLYGAALEAINKGFAASAHDVSQGGFAVAISEMAFAGGFGADIDFENMAKEKDISEIELLFGESPSRIIIEIEKENEKKFLSLIKGLAIKKIGVVKEDPLLDIKFCEKRLLKENIFILKDSWKRELL